MDTVADTVADTVVDTVADTSDTPVVAAINNLLVVANDNVNAPTDSDTHIFIVLASLIGIAFAIVQFCIVNQISLKGSPHNRGEEHYREKDLEFIFSTITKGAKSFLFAEYKICAIFIVVFGIIVFILVAHPWEQPVWLEGGLTAISFVVGACTSILSGYIGMMVAVYSNARTAVAATEGGKDNPTLGWTGSFNLAFRAGNVMGFSLCGLSLIILYILCLIYRAIFGIDGSYPQGSTTNVLALFECIAGYGLGGSSIAMFGRVGGGIFTKAADVGADLAGKVIGVQDPQGNKKKLDEDSPYNPACIADNVGDNVGDVAGMGSDLFGSFGEASCAALLVGASVLSIGGNATTAGTWSFLMFPLTISATGILVCLVVSFLATHVKTVKKEADVETVLKIQLFMTSLVLTGVMYPVAISFLPPDMDFTSGSSKKAVILGVKPWAPYLCVLAGLWGGCIIGFITEYFTSHSYRPTRDVAESTETGAATNIIYGLALGYKSVILPAIIIAIIIFLAFRSCGMYGIALGALGMLSNLATCLSIDVYGPVCDNAGGIAEMVHMPSWVRDKTDALDAAGNTTAAIGKGFAIGSAALVSLALFGAFITRSQNSGNVSINLNMLQPIVFAFLLFGAMVPYWFSAMTMRSVGKAAKAMVNEVARQFKSRHHLSAVAAMDDKDEIDSYIEKNDIKIETELADYDACITIATNASLREMIAPGMLVIATPILVGIFFGVEAVAGLLGGAMVSSVQLAISMSNTGGAWDNAKKYCEKGELNGKFQFDSNQKYGTFNPKGAQTGNDAFSLKQKPDLGSWLKDTEKNNPEKYHDIMIGKLPIYHNDHEEPVENKGGNYLAYIYSGKKSEAHSACVTGDTVGDPLKDTSGPALNIVMKLMAIISVVFADTFISINEGRGVFNIQSIHT